MGYKEAQKLMPFIRKGSKKKIDRLMKMTNRVEIIPEIYQNRGMTEHERQWRQEIEDWKAKIEEAHPGYQLKGNESINELQEIWQSLKISSLTTWPDNQIPSF